MNASRRQDAIDVRDIVASARFQTRGLVGTRFVLTLARQRCAVERAIDARLRVAPSRESLRRDRAALEREGPVEIRDICNCALRRAVRRNTKARRL